MKCKQIESRLIAYLDGKLGPREREAVELHAQSCSRCAERITGFSEVFQALDSWKDIEPSPSFDARLDQRLEAEYSSAGWWGSLFPRLAPLPLRNAIFAMALLVVVSLAALTIRYSPAPPRELARQQPEPLVVSAGVGVDDLTLYRNLPVLEDLDVLGNFEVLQELTTTNVSQRSTNRVPQ